MTTTRLAPLLVALVVGLTVHASAADAARTPVCTSTSVKVLVRAFVSSYNAGQVASADRLWASEPRFEWFSAGAPRSPARRLGTAAYDRSSLRAYFRARADSHERLRIVELGGGYDPKRHLLNFGGKVVRSADDLRSQKLDFKGAADCASASPRLIVWSM